VRYASSLARYRDTTYAGLAKELGTAQPSDAALTFDPLQLKHFDRIRQELKLTPEEVSTYAKHGVVAVDHGRRYSMGSAYFAIYARDLPVLITTDSVAHALHRSYDKILAQLEAQMFLPALEEALRGAHAVLAKQRTNLQAEPLRSSARDVDLYLTVARNLLGGMGAAPATAQNAYVPPELPKQPVASHLAQDADVKVILDHIASLQLQAPETPTQIYGGTRSIDYSQFQPRGHYTESAELSRYFRAMMWLGRADTAFIIHPPNPKSSLEVNAQREARSAALMTMVMKESGALAALDRIRSIVDFMVGRADNLTLGHMQTALGNAGLNAPVDLADDARLNTLRNEVGSLAVQQIRSQVITSPISGQETIPPPQTFQVFGQSFVIDSFALSKVVFDEILFKGEKQRRLMPSGADVWAALGNDEAVRLLKPELEKWNYSANLLAVRKTIDERSDAAWSQDLYNLWLNALRELDETPDGHLPQVMRREPWRRKQLQTQLASWSELRHDTLLYAKQSYSAYPSCGYPAGFVEPYPAFFDRLERFAQRGAELIGTADFSTTDAQRTKAMRGQRDGIVQYLRSFAENMKFLAELARKELAAKPFTSEEQEYLRRTIDRSGGGSGPPRYDGWFPKLIYGGDPDAWKPTIADVHTNPRDQKTLQVGVGDVSFIVVAIDNEQDRAAYVGPVYTYYEFTGPVSDRLTDEKWREWIQRGNAPAAPSFTQPFRAKPLPRDLGLELPIEQRQDAYSKELTALLDQYRNATDKAAQDRLYKKIEKLRETRREPPKSPATPATKH
jgi:hypothetical protein